MAYRSKADGITKSGRTKGKNLGDDGSSIGQDGITLSSGKAKTVTNSNLRKYGRNMARIKNQGGK